MSARAPVGPHRPEPRAVAMPAAAQETAPEHVGAPPTPCARSARAREFKEHVERALGGDKSAKVHSRRLMAYELVREHEKLMFSNDPSLSRMLEAQWIEILREAEQHAGLLQQSAVMVDVSGSMTC